MPDVEAPLPPACLTLAVCEWYSGALDADESMTFHFWNHMLAGGVIREEIDEDDPSVTRLVYILDHSREVKEKTTKPYCTEGSHAVSYLVTAHKARIVLDDA